MGHDVLTRSPSGLSERRTGFSPPELGSPTAPVVPPTGAVPCPLPGDLPRRAAGAGGALSTALRLARGPSTGRDRGWPVVRRATRLGPCPFTPSRSPSSAPPAASGPARWPWPSGDACRPPVRRRWSSTSTSPGVASRSLPVSSTCPAGGGTTCEVCAGGFRPTSSCPPCRASRGARCCRHVAAALRACPTGRSSTSSTRCSTPRRRWSSTCRPRAPCCRSCWAAAPSSSWSWGCGPGHSPMPTPASSACSARRRMPVTPAHPDGGGGRGRGGAEPDLRLVTRGGRARAEVLDDVVAHLGLAHLHHLLDDVRVPRDAERGVFPGVARDAVRRCADVVVGAVDELAAAS